MYIAHVLSNGGIIKEFIFTPEEYHFNTIKTMILQTITTGQIWLTVNDQNDVEIFDGLIR